LNLQVALLDPQRYLQYVLERIADHPINRIEKLLPWNVVDKLAQSQQVTNALAAEGFRMSESSLAFASPPPLALNPDNRQEFLDRTHSQITIGEMLTVSGATTGCGR
jgi:hypothetical protein